MEDKYSPIMGIELLLTPLAYKEGSEKRERRRGEGGGGRGEKEGERKRRRMWNKTG